MAYVFYESGLSINVMYGIEDGGEAGSRASSSQTGMEVPEELAAQLQVRAPEVEAGRGDPRLLLRHQGRVLRSAGERQTCCHLAGDCETRRPPRAPDGGR